MTGRILPHGDAKAANNRRRASLGSMLSAQAEHAVVRNHAGETGLGEWVGLDVQILLNFMSIQLVQSYLEALGETPSLPPKPANAGQMRHLDSLL